METLTIPQLKKQFNCKKAKIAILNDKKVLINEKHQAMANITEKGYIHKIQFTNFS